MKKNKISFETNFWAANEIENVNEVISAFFNYAHLDYYKQTLTEVLFYSYKSKVYKHDNPSELFMFYTIARSFLKVGYCMNKKSKNWNVKEATTLQSRLHLASLTEEEYRNPLVVFKKAFAENTVEEFEIFLCEVIHMSLCSDKMESDSDLITPYIYCVKMLDALQLIKERGLEKIKQKKKLSGQ
ncbi:hypothetical protein [Flavobacterium daejeonense]|uniref:hypothetical protein n=1 Tax=Flavobacterium daejeonense TaxID=350893 RepID=UPI00055943BA|nr:hypothetical protein [Flavobacterium daejeonense]